MAEAASSALLQLVFNKLESSILEEFGLSSSLRADFENLRSTISTILTVLEDAEKRQLKEKAVQNWLRKLKNAAYSADDILDEFTTEVLQRKLENEEPITKKARNFFSFSNPIVFRLCMARKIKDINNRLDIIAAERLKFHFREGVQVAEARGREQTDSFVIESDIYGREEDKERLVELLLHVGNQEELSVIPVVGMGGLGKTTLAQLVHNDKRLEGHFDSKVWVCVSDDYDLKRLLKAIVESSRNSKCDFEDLDLLQRNLQEMLRCRRFLLILDDFWDENHEKWEHLKKFLQGGERGSAIIVTTRSEKVASIMGTLPSHYPTRLSDKDCWCLFKQRAFRHEENPSLVKIGKEIVKKCGGIPLAAKALGGLMRFKTEEREWQFVKESEIWNLPEENSILPALRLSYYHLPQHLKQCFAYCSIFPKDLIISKRPLIQLWIAEGFIKPTQGSKPMEDIGVEYFNILWWQSFFQDAEKDNDGNIESCKMHDLMHDLANSVSGAECSIVTADSTVTIPEGCRHLNVVHGTSEKTSTMVLNGAKNLRTLLLDHGITLLSHNVSSHLLCLRVLRLIFADITNDMLNAISQLKQLRYLELSGGKFRVLPESLIKLYNLQTLVLIDCASLEKLPRGMRKMSNLRHLCITGCNSLTCMPAKMGEINFLQTLSMFIVDEDSGCDIKELRNLKLRGYLKIQKLENVRGAGNAREAKLSEKADLQHLEFSWSNYFDSKLRELSEQTLEGLQPHPNLKSLKLENYAGERVPRWMSCSFLTNLVDIWLINCRILEQLPSLGQLPSLKYLEIRGLAAVICIDNHFYGDNGFPSLETLIVGDMPNLKEWSGSNCRQVLPCLRNLTVNGCLKLAAIPYFPSLSTLTISSFMEAESLPGCFFQNRTHVSKLEIRDCPKLRSLPRELGNLASLEELQIHRCSNLVALLPEEMQNNSYLKRLWIDDCVGLTSLRLQGLTSLSQAVIQGCKNLVRFVGGMQGLSALKGLRISGCRELVAWTEGMESLTSLEALQIWSCDKVTCLPEGLKHARVLRRLEIYDLSGLAALPEWIGNLTSLQYLSIRSCHKLVSLPSALQHLTSLKHLKITDCHELEKRCEKEMGEDSDKIAHIPHIQIGEE